MSACAVENRVSYTLDWTQLSFLFTCQRTQRNVKNRGRTIKAKEESKFIGAVLKWIWLEIQELVKYVLILLKILGIK